jgi:hypothetical protein
MMDECEASLQVLRGVDADITVEANDIKARTCFHSSRMDGYSLFENSLHSVYHYYYFLQHLVHGSMCFILVESEVGSTF